MIERTTRTAPAAVTHPGHHPGTNGHRAAPAALVECAPPAVDLRAEVLRGLRRRNKTLPCKLFYDERGSQLFDEICALPEYYLTRTETAILERHAGEMAAAFGAGCRVIEYGSGSSIKTRILLDHLFEPAGYVPIDISREHLIASASRLSHAYPNLSVTPVCADYTADFTLPPGSDADARNIVFFPGSTIGNFEPDEARSFLRRVARVCGPGGGLLIGVDLKKDPAVLHAAYNDAAGVTAAFNLNMLARINADLGADFNASRFAHYAFYNTRLGRIEMHLVSREEQVVHVGGEEPVHFDDGESVHTENSHKYTLPEFARLAGEAGFAVRRTWLDDRRWFSVQYLTVGTDE